MIDATVDSQPVPTAATGVPVLQQLRAATAASHTALEDRLPFMRPELDRALYCKLIQAYYGFYVPLEHLLASFPDPDPSAPDRKKVPALLRDLTALGLTTAQIEALPLCADLPTISHSHQRFGARYVIEGATLGGQVLRRVIKARLGIEADSGAEFLDVYGRDTGPLWKAFLQQLADADEPPYQDQVVDAACATFNCFERWLDQAGVLTPAAA